MTSRLQRTRRLDPVLRVHSFHCTLQRPRPPRLVSILLQRRAVYVVVTATVDSCGCRMAAVRILAVHLRCQRQSWILVWGIPMRAPSISTTRLYMHLRRWMLTLRASRVSAHKANCRRRPMSRRRRSSLATRLGALCLQVLLLSTLPTRRRRITLMCYTSRWMAPRTSGHVTT